MKDKTKRIARLSVLTAVGVVLSFLADVLPSGRLGLMVLASFPVCLALLLYGVGWAFGVFVVTAVLGLLLFPSVSSLGFAAFFGYYPIAKSLFERVHSRTAGWLLKYALFGVVFLAYWLAARGLYDYNALVWVGLFLGLGLVFGLYDWCYSLVIRFYFQRLARYFS
jgi:hypothetical protein